MNFNGRSGLKSKLRRVVLVSFSLTSLICHNHAPAAASEASSIPAPSPSPTPKPRSAIVLPAVKVAPVKVPRFDKPPIIDGKLDDEAWSTAEKLKDFYQTQPGLNIAPSVQTEVLIGYDSKFLYVAFHCFDDFFFADSGQTLRRKENGLAYAFDYNKNGGHLIYDVAGVGTLFSMALADGNRISNWHLRKSLRTSNGNGWPAIQIFHYMRRPRN